MERHMGLGKNGGSAAVRVRDIIAEWEQLGGMRLFHVDAVYINLPTPSDLPPPVADLLPSATHPPIPLAEQC